MKAMRVHWSLHPIKSQGLYYDPETKKNRSPWYDGEIKRKKMGKSAVARELDISYEGSVEGIIFPEFGDHHILRGDYELNPYLPIVRTFDYGACCYVLFSQVDQWGRVLCFYEICIEQGGNAHRLAQAALSYSAKLKTFKGFRDHDDPAGSYDGWVNGSTSWQIMNSYGITPTHTVTASSNQRRTDRIEMIHRKLDERVGGEEVIQIHEDCPILIAALQGEYRHPVDKNGKVNLDDVEEIHPFEDAVDCFGITLLEELSVYDMSDLDDYEPPRRYRDPYTKY